jgi:BASS family bile acid:Na+ symporter
MLSMGITLSVDDFKRVFSRPLPVGIGFLLCFGLCPAIALALSKALALPAAMTAGMLLVGSINGASTSISVALLAVHLITTSVCI